MPGKPKSPMNKLKEKQQWINWVSLFLLLLLIVHFTLSLAYSFLPESKRLKGYMEPLFTQNFKIFAPNVPETESSLFISYFTKSQGWSSWQAVGLQDRNSAQTNTFSTHRFSLLIHQNTLHNLHYIVETAAYFNQQYKKKSTSIINCAANEIRYLPEFKYAQKYCQDYCTKQFPTSSDLKFKCCLVTSAISEKNMDVSPIFSTTTKFDFLYFNQP